jgi:DNA-binding transcriptional LysR family regulator
MVSRRRHDIPPPVLRSFVAVNRLGNFSRAAEELGITQSAVSGQMKHLQQVVGGEIFAKSAAGFGLTDLGLLVDRYARRILTLNDQVVAIAGTVHNRLTIRLAIQNTFALKMLAEVKNKCESSIDSLFQFICGNAREIDHLVTSGYVDLAFGLCKSGTRRNLLATWNEKLVWVGAPNISPLKHNKPIPFVGRKAGFMDEMALKCLEDLDVPYRVTFRGSDLGALIAAVLAGLGLMVSPARFIPEPLVEAAADRLPVLSAVGAGVFCREGFDLKRNKALVNAFLSVVSPPDTLLANESHNLNGNVNGKKLPRRPRIVAPGGATELDTI